MFAIENKSGVFSEYGSYHCDKLNTYFKSMEIVVLAWKQYNPKTAGYFCALKSIVLIKSPYMDNAAKTISKLIMTLNIIIDSWKRHNRNHI